MPTANTSFVALVKDGKDGKRKFRVNVGQQVDAKHEVIKGREDLFDDDDSDAAKRSVKKAAVRGS